MVQLEWVVESARWCCWTDNSNLESGKRVHLQCGGRLLVTGNLACAQLNRDYG